MEKINAPIDGGPGFFFVNETDWPIAYSIEQYECLYHDVIGVGEAMRVPTGAVWFTLRFSIQPDGISANLIMSIIFFFEREVLAPSREA